MTHRRKDVAVMVSMLQLAQAEEESIPEVGYAIISVTMELEQLLPDSYESKKDRGNRSRGIEHWWRSWWPILSLAMA